ncbi:hypothetical protein [Streptomyces sp. AS02]|uniref:hypothetical protein n=1 Tax=Streptomyces sp. AS02 TaxID=2938946 RepID=UPI00202244EB|nr:hypothetical protein [Streptomyces sp. AS02]MCL8017034.1 hypothetical protein [Streptomyces sp. AS02]
MSTRTTFEDRLLDQLKREIELRESGGGVAETGTGGVEAGTSARLSSTLLTPRRIAVVAAACAAAWLGSAAVPGSPTDSKAYAVERHGDGSVELSVKDQQISVADQRELAGEVRPWGIHVTIDVLSPGYVCDRSQVTSAIAVVDEQGNRVPLIPVESSWDLTLRRGNVLAFENTRGGTAPRAVEFYESTSTAEPCVPRKVVLPKDQPTP